MNELTYGTVRSAGLRYSKVQSKSGVKTSTKIGLAAIVGIAVLTMINPVSGGSLVFVGLCGYLAFLRGKSKTAF